MTTKKQYPIPCQEIFNDLRSNYPKSYLKAIVGNSKEVSLRRVQGVMSGDVKNPEKIIQVARICIKIMRQNIDTSYAVGRKIVLNPITKTKTKR